MAILPTLLYNAETWVEISREAEERLENIQLFYLRLVLRLPKGTPKPALLSETGLLGMKYRIWKKKGMLAHHIKNLDSSTLAKQVWTEQRSQHWPGLAKEVSSICAELGVDDVSTNIVEEKQALKTKISKACLALNDSKLKESMEGMTKMSELI